MTPKFPWFAARLLFESEVSGSDEDEALFEERIVLVYSPSGLTEAAKKARKLGEATGSEYAIADQDSVSWRFKEVLDLVQIDESTIGEGSEVYHHYLTAGEVDGVRQSLKSGSL